VVTAERRPPSWLPWALCWISLGLLLFGVGLRIAFPEEEDGGVFDTVVHIPGYALVPLVGALIAARLPTNPYGWLWSALGLLYGVLVVGDGLRRIGAVPGWLAAALIGGTFLTSLCLLVLLLLLFPTGRLPDRRWRWLARAAVLLTGVGLLVLPFVLNAIDSVRPAPWALGGSAGRVLAALLQGEVTAMFVLVVLAAASLLVRFRRAGPVERQQLKWFVLAAVLAAATVMADVLGVPVGGPVWAVVDALSFALLPVSVGIAVLRYRLYEIDRIVSRTVSYGLLTAALIGLYLLVVALLRPLLEPVTGTSSLAVAASTLAVAAAFNPARRRLQAAVDRRFDRARYDAALAVDAFAARLRDQVDLDEVTAGLRETVAATVAPTRVGVWLTGPSRWGGG
jgi:MFS family permease